MLANIGIPLLSFLIGFFPIAFAGALFYVRVIKWRDPRPGDLLRGATLSLAGHSLIFTMVGFLGLLDFILPLTALTCLLLILTAWSCARKPEHRSAKPVRWSDWEATDIQSRVLIALIVTYEIGMLVAATAPCYNPDCEGAHYLFMRHYLGLGHIGTINQNGYSYYPQAIEMMLLPAFKIGGESGPEAGNVCHWFLQLLLVGWVIDFGASRGKKSIGWHTAAVVCGIHMWKMLAYSGLIDMGVALFSVAAMFTWFGQVEKGDSGGQSDMLLAAVFLGTAVASKYSSLFPALLIAVHIVLLVLNRKSRSWLLPRVIPGLAAFLLVAAPWYLRNLIETGNPLYPFFRGVLGSPQIWLADDVNTWAGWGVRVTLRNFLLYPFILAFSNPVESAPFLMAPLPYSSWLTPLAPVAAVFLFRKRLERIAVVWCAVFFTYAFFTMSKQARYFLPFTILALWLVVTFLFGFVKPGKAGWEGIARWIIFAVVALQLLSQFVLLGRDLKADVPFLAGRVSRNEYNESVFPSSGVFNKANELGNEQGKICMFGLRTYRLEAPWEFPPFEVFEQSDDVAEIVSRLSEMKFGLLLVPTAQHHASIVLGWCLERQVDPFGISVIPEDELSAISEERGVRAGRARNLIYATGGERVDINGERFWKVDLRRFRSPVLQGIIDFESRLSSMDDVSQVAGTDQWELFEMRTDREDSE